MGVQLAKFHKMHIDIFRIITCATFNQAKYGYFHIAFCKPLVSVLPELPLCNTTILPSYYMRIQRIQ